MRPLLLLALLLSPTVARAADFQDLAAVERAAVIAAGADIGQPGGPSAPVDRRLKLVACAQLAVDPPLYGALTVRCPAAGWRLRIPLVRGPGGTAAAHEGAIQTAERAPVRAEPVVRRGDPVELEAGSGSFTVSTQAIAQEDGAPGTRIRVKPDAKSTIIFAEVVESGRVRLQGFN